MHLVLREIDLVEEKMAQVKYDMMVSWCERKHLTTSLK